jgi:hypothetical protein
LGSAIVDAKKITAVVASVAVLIGLGDMPYGYYSLLRLGLCGFCLFLLLGSDAARIEWQRWLLGATAVLYNPVFPIRIGDKSIWIVLNIATVALLWIVAARRSSGESSPR